MKNYFKKNSGYSLIEVLVAISVFTIIMTISMGSILSIFDANKKSKNLQTVMDNLNLAVESMTRSIRFGTAYHCDITVLPLSSTRDCNTGATSISFTDASGRSVSYSTTSTQIYRSINGGSSYAMTSSDVIITNLTFYVVGSAPYSSGSNTQQPEVIMVMKGYVGVQTNARTIDRSSTFTLETTVSERNFDSQ